MQLRRSIRLALVSGVALTLCAATGLATRLPAAGAPERSALADRFTFHTRYVNGDPADGREVRQVQPSLHHIRSWISAVGASAGLADHDGDGMANERCLVDPRDDSVTIAATPDAAHRIPAFPLVPKDVYYDAKITAPMGCLPADLNEDGYTDVLVYFWGRTPVAHLRKPGVALSSDAFVTVDVTAEPHRIWNSTTANVVDFDGDGHLDLFIGNYFPDGARVLDPAAADNPEMKMHDSMSWAANGGRNTILRLDRLTMVDGVRRPHYVDASAALTKRQSMSWTLATGAQDLDRDGLPELYVANDFGPDYLLHNRSRPGEIRFAELRGERHSLTPKSKAVGNDSFKGMGVTFTELNNDARPDLVVSNITTSFGLEESNFAFVSTGSGPLADGRAPYDDHSEPLGLSRSGWGWDIKAGDFDGDGTDELVQAVGFLRGHTNRWALLQELAMTNDVVIKHPWSWPRFQPGDDIAGHQRNPFFVREGTGAFVDIAADLGIDNPGVSRGIAVGDVDHDGKLDVLVANQWARSTFLHNKGPDRTHLGLRLVLPAIGPDALPRPAIGAAVTVTRPGGGVMTGQLFPANGHTGVNAPELLFGLGSSTGPLGVTVTWRDAAGVHTTTTTLQPGWHTLVLDAS